MSEVDAAATEADCHGPLWFLFVLCLTSFCAKPLEWLHNFKQRREEKKYAGMATSSPFSV
ncbi:uncharacterized protein RHO25_006152 [Cercospora beticola]|uniref:Uncharacterized protein n=1 Tax=Cercospora beticola TaxID=122368 RepID=A0ABZ0NPY3_CERBT|nr:hypothetical protein RHO25_006152 [Cercospora beticola]